MADQENQDCDHNSATAQQDGSYICNNCGEILPGEQQAPAPSEAPKPEQPKSGVLTDEDKRELNLAVLTENTAVMNPTEYAQMKKLAQDFYNSRALSDAFDNVEQVIMALAAGREMGMGFGESINNLYFVGGRLNVYGKGTPAALRRQGWRFRFSEETGDSCTATVWRGQGVKEPVDLDEQYTDTFTFKDAEGSNFTTNSYGKLKPGWLPGANRKRKLRYGVLSLIIHTYVPEVLGPVAGIAEYSQDYIEAETLNTPRAPQKADKQDAKAKAKAILANLPKNETTESDNPHKTPAEPAEKGSEGDDKDA